MELLQPLATTKTEFGIPSSIVWGLAGVLCFSLTLPVTRLISADFHPLFIAMGRCVLASLLALLLLSSRRVIQPSPKQLRQLALTSLGVVFGFPILSAIAMTSVPASHGGVVIALLPLGTALAATLIAAERCSKNFWRCSLAATVLVTGYALLQAQGTLQMGDIALLLSLPLASMGYAMGGHLAKSMPGWQVICWVLVISLPLTAPLAAFFAPTNMQQIPMSSWSGFVYLALFSQLFGFFFWYKGLAMGGIARASQLQLLQPFATLLFAWWLLAEVIPASAALVCAAVAGLIYWGRKR